MSDLLVDRANAEAAGMSDYVDALDGLLGETEVQFVEVQEELASAREHLQTLRDTPTPVELGDVKSGGREDYYEFRENDFIERNPGLAPPGYYLSYGDKYLERFTNEWRPGRGDVAQAWASRTRWELQNAIEQLLRTEPATFAQLERTSAAFTKFAFDTHPDAYLRGGLSHLSLSETLSIGGVPDVRDLATQNGMAQIFELTPKLLTEDLTQCCVLDMGFGYAPPLKQMTSEPSSE